MTLDERLKLINAGYTKDEIAAMEEKKDPEKKDPEKKEEKTFSEFLAAEIARALSSAAKPDPEPEKKPEEKKKEEKSESDDEVIKKLVAEQLKAFFQPSIKIDPVTDLSDISKRLFEVKITKDGEK